jgi:hypothetical protein
VLTLAKVDLQILSQSTENNIWQSKACRTIWREPDRNKMSATQKPLHVSFHWIWFIVLVVLLDQSTKHLVVHSLEPNRPMAHPAIGGFRAVL